MLDSIVALRVPLACVSHTPIQHVLSAFDLPFNPIRLLFLVGWVYLCVYCVQRVHFSPLVPQAYKTVANVVTLFTGPFLLLTLLLIHTAQQTSQTRENFFDVLKREIHKALGQTVKEVMSDRHVTSIAPDKPLREAAQIMHERTVNSLPVVDNSGQVIGILTRGDIVRAMGNRCSANFHPALCYRF